MIDDKALFGLTVAQQAAEDTNEAARIYGGLGEAAVRDDLEAADYTQEIMEAIGAEHCAICGRWYLPVDDCPLCTHCLAYENQAWADHTEELTQAYIISVGLG